MVSKAATARLCVLGKFELRLGSRVVIDRRWKHRKAQALLKLLALQPGATLHREQVMAALWPEKDADAGANNLHKAAHYLRQAFAGVGSPYEPVVLDRHSVSLNPDIVIDAVIFSDLAAHAAAAKTDVSLYEQALAAYAGDLLPDDIYEEWTEPHREELRQCARRLRLELTALYASGAQYDAALTVLMPVTHADPCDEDAHTLLVRIFAQKGDRGSATRAYEQFTHALNDELGVAPGVELPEIVRAAHNAAAAAPPPPMPDVRYATTTDGIRIAYQTIGEPHRDRLPLVQMAAVPWSDLKIEWEMPEWRHWLQRLSRHRQVIRYDGRALGLSQRDVTDLSIEAQSLDLEAVADALGLARFDLLSLANNGQSSITYMHNHPGRVRRMVTYMSFADGPAFGRAMGRPGYSTMMREDWDLYLDATGRAAVGFFEEFALRHIRWLKTTGPDLLHEFLRRIEDCDVTPILPGVEVPVLGLGRSAPYFALAQDLLSPFVLGVPKGRIVWVPGEYHFIAGDIEPLIAEIDAFLDASDAALAEQPRESGALPLR